MFLRLTTVNRRQDRVGEMGAYEKWTLTRGLKYSGLIEMSM